MYPNADCDDLIYEVELHMCLTVVSVLAHDAICIMLVC